MPIPDKLLPSVPPSALARILDDFQAAGVRPTPLGVISKATDDGLSDGELRALIAELAAQPDLSELRV